MRLFPSGRRASRPRRAAAPGRPPGAPAGRIFAEAFGRVEVDTGVAAIAAEPRALDLGELEAVRDELADRVAEAGARSRAGPSSRPRNRELLGGCWPRRRSTVAEDLPRRRRRARLRRTGTRVPRLGPIGMLMGWWRVKVSSGCPLAGRLAAVEREAQG